MKKPIKIKIQIIDENGDDINSKCIDIEDSKLIEEMNLSIAFLGDGHDLHLSTIEFMAKHFNKLIFRNDAT